MTTFCWVWGASPDLVDFAVELAVRVGVHREIHVLVHFHIADVRFGDRGVDLHLGQIVSDFKKCVGELRLAATGISPDVDGALNDEAVDGESRISQ